MGSTRNVAHHSAQKSRTSFLSLPHELRTDIIGMACLPESSDGSLDYETIYSLMLTGRHIHIYGARLLYRTIRITKPSMLAELVFALISRPELGALIQTMHLGPERHHEREWWPMAEHGIGLPDVRSGEVRLICTSLEDEEVLPRWCGARRCFVLNSRGEVDHRDAAVLRAVEAAEQAFGIDLKRPRYSHTGEEIGSTHWLVGILEIQSVLDLYLIELRRMEDEAGQSEMPAKIERYSRESPAHTGPRLDYPPLLLSDSPASPNAHQEACKAQVFQLSRGAVLDYLFRRGGPANSFDHPLLLARSGLQLLEIDDAGQASATSHAMLSDSEGFAFPDTSTPSSSSNLADALTTHRRAPSTAREVLALGHTLLVHAPQLRHLFLSGILQHLITHHQPSSPLPPLRSVFLGPLSHCHGDSLGPSPGEGRFANLKRLHMRGRRFAKEKIAAISELPRLRDVVWELQYAEGSVEE